ncbi:MAG: hypothetical protein PHC88_07515 [Terrimicrobiaceae bacterium]|nr:hypothetical protein [Terrimicrobiaceae bacterium]
MNQISEIEDAGEIRHGLGPIWAATRIANPDFAVCAPVTFRAGAAFPLSTTAWRDDVFAPILLPALRGALGHARRCEVRELAALDRRLSEQLGDGLRTASIRAGRRLALHGSDLRGDRLLPRLAENLRTDTASGHLAIVFAARCGAFSLPDTIAVGAYIFQEMCAGAPTAGVSAVCDFVARCIEPLGGPSIELRAA